MIRTEIKQNINFPKVTLQEDLEVIAGDIIKDMQNRIKQRKTILGGPLSENEPSTIRRKGHDKPLQDTGRLMNSFYSKRVGKDKVIISLTPDRHEIGTYLQSGIRSNKGYKNYAFFGISVFAERKAIAYMKKKIKEMVNG